MAGLIHLDSRCVVSDEDCTRNMRINVARGLPLCVPVPGKEGRLACVGAGPSVLKHLDELLGYDEIWAVNGAYEFLIDNGIVPHGFVAVDPLPGLAEYVRAAHPATLFYISALCASEVFEALVDFNVEIWFPNGQEVDWPIGAWLVPGGTTALTRCPGLAKMLGWRDVTIFGGDSSFAADRRYAYGDGKYAEDSRSKVVRVMLDNGEGPFYSEEALLKQACQFGVLAQTPAIKLSFRCGGLLDAFLKAPTMERDLHEEFNEYNRTHAA